MSLVGPKNDFFCIQLLEVENQTNFTNEKLNLRKKHEIKSTFLKPLEPESSEEGQTFWLLFKTTFVLSAHRLLQF